MISEEFGGMCGKQSQLLLQPTEVELGLQVGVEFDNTVYGEGMIGSRACSV